MPELTLGQPERFTIDFPYIDFLANFFCTSGLNFKILSSAFEALGTRILRKKLQKFLKKVTIKKVGIIRGTGSTPKYFLISGKIGAFSPC